MTFLLVLFFFVGLINAAVGFLAQMAVSHLGDEMDLDEKLAARFLAYGGGFNALLLFSAFTLLV